MAGAVVSTAESYRLPDSGPSGARGCRAGRHLEGRVRHPRVRAACHDAAMADGPRSLSQRKADTLAKLETRHADTWLATASGAGVAHMVPLSFAWHDGLILVATPPRTLSARNMVASGRARLAMGDTHDVVMVDAELDRAFGAKEAPAELAEAFAAQAGWDPRSSKSGHAIFSLRPRRIQAWRREDEWAGRVIMTDGAWLI
jgi:hypothetical protein